MLKKILKKLIRCTRCRQNEFKQFSSSCFVTAEPTPAPVKQPVSPQKSVSSAEDILHDREVNDTLELCPPTSCSKLLRLFYIGLKPQ